MNKSITYLLNSPTVMSWLSYLTKTLTIVLVTPLLVTNFTAGDVTIWYLFVSAVSFQLLSEVGFSSTFIRIFAFANGGLSIDQIKTIGISKDNKINASTNWSTVEVIWQNMNYVYTRLSGVFLIFILASTFFLFDSLGKGSNVGNAWSSWGIIVVTSFLQMRFSTYSHFLQGMNKIALVKKYESIFNLLSIFSNAIVLYLGGGLLALVISNQFWGIFNTFRDYFLAKNIKGFESINRKSKKNKLLFDIVWPSAWKSGVGLLLSVGLLHISNMYFVKFLDVKLAASYLLGYNIIRQISNFAQAPFYARIPTMAILRAQNKISELVNISQKGILLTLWSFILLVIIGGGIGRYGLVLIKSNVEFPTFKLWFLLGLGILIERYGAMHIQIYSTTNRIIWHIANGITGLIYVITFFLLKDSIGVFVFPISILISNLLFYSWYCASHSYRSMQTSFFKFEKFTFLPSFIFYSSLLLLVYILDI